MNFFSEDKLSHMLVARKPEQHGTSVCVGSAEGKKLFIGGGKPVVIAGPCALEAEEEALSLAKGLKELGVSIFRAMLFKPRSSPYSFQGLGEAGLSILDEIKKQTSLLLLSEVCSEREADLTAPHADILQIGTRNMSNFELLKHVGRLNRPIVLKRGMGASIIEWLNAAEYILAEGNPNVILCERGIKTFELYTRFTLDISAIPAVKELSHLPIIADPSHASGRRSLITPLSRAILASGADGLMVEVHQSPQNSLSDAKQALSLNDFIELKKSVQVFL